MALHISIILTVLLLLPISRLLQILFDPLRRIPGPWAAKFSSLWLAFHVWQGKFHNVNLDLHRNYGKIVRIRPNEYSFDDPAAVKPIYGAGSRFTKGDWYWGATSVPVAHLNLFALQDLKVHSNLKRKQAMFYSMSFLHKYEPFVDGCTRKLTSRLQDCSRTGKPIDLMHWLQCYAFDVVTEMTFGQPFGFLHQGDDIDGLMALAERIQRYSAFIGIFPRLHTILSGTLKLDSASEISKYAVRMIQERLFNGVKTANTDPVDFLSLFMDQMNNNPEVYTFETGVSMLSSNLAAGSDTTGISLGSIFFHLMQEPRCVQRLLEDINTAYPQKGVLELFTFKEAQELPYLQAIIKEALRLHPVGGMPLARRVPKGGATISGVHFPEGAVVGVNAWVAHRNAEVFGSEVNRFKPERWLEADPASLSAMEKYFLPFGSGARTCIGKNISLLEMSKLVPYLVRNFVFTVQDPQQWLDTLSCDWFVKPKKLQATVREKEGR